MSTANLVSHRPESLTAPLEASPTRCRHLEAARRLPHEPATLLETAGYPAVQLTHEVLEHHKRRARQIRRQHMRQMVQRIVDLVLRRRTPGSERG